MTGAPFAATSDPNVLMTCGKEKVRLLGDVRNIWKETAFRSSPRAGPRTEETEETEKGKGRRREAEGIEPRQTIPCMEELLSVTCIRVIPE